MNIDKIMSELTLEEKAALCSGKNFWETKSIERLGIPSVMVCDGPHGLRKQEGKGDHLGINESIKAVCFPTGVAIASSFDEGLARRLGEILGMECQAENVSMALGPAVNIKRSPLCGRNFEYLSEDPLVAGKMGAAMVNGLQSQGISPCVKHFAANNQESYRMVSDSVVDERTLHEIYYAVWETIVKEAKPRSVMVAYNKVNGTYCVESKELLTDVLRNRWGFDGVTVTDWGAVKDPVKGIQSGLDLVMPGGNDVCTQKIIASVKDGSLSQANLDNAVRNVLTFVEYATANKKDGVVFNRDADYKLASDIAKECAVLLKNENNILPLNKEMKIAIIGEAAEVAVYQGSGSSFINSAKLTTAKEAASGLNFSYARGYRSDTFQTDEGLLSEAVKLAETSDVAVIFIGLPNELDTEGADRDDLRLSDNQNALISAIADVQHKTVVVLHNGAPVEMPWADKVPAILEMYLAGDACGEAAISILLGETNPSGKLAETFPKKLEDTPCYMNFPGERGYVEYREGIFVGYRYYDKKKMDVLFPFGHGLSYTKFEYSNIRLNKTEIEDTETLDVTITVTNTGSRFGKEAVQLYVRDIESTPIRPVRELKAFTKVPLEAGESKDITFTMGKRAFAYYEPRLKDFAVETGEFAIEIGASSQDIRLSASVTVYGTDVIPIIFSRDSTIGEILSNPKGQAIMASIRGSGAVTSMSNQEVVQTLGSGASRMMQKMKMERPLSAVATIAGMTDEQVDGLIAMLNS